MKNVFVKKRSAVWEFFKQVDNEGKKRVVCELCKASLAYCGGTTTIKTHLTHKHPSILLGKDEGAGPSRILGAKKQSNMKNFVLGSKPKMSKERYEKITMKLAHFCAHQYTLWRWLQKFHFGIEFPAILQSETM